MQVPSRLIALVMFCASSAGAVDPRVQVKDVEIGNQRYSVVAVVEGTVPVTVTLDPAAEYENCAPSTPLPLQRVVTKTGETVLVEVGPANPKAKWRCAYRFKSNLGDSLSSAPEDCRLSLPFRPTGKYEVIQGFDGTLTHQGRVRHAIDFAMPEGTPVLAAREGVVTWIQDDARDGTRRGGNTVSLLHADGTFTQYAHLKRGSVLVKDGQTIHRGTVLALSGSTNDQPVVPHLHFEVFVNPGDERRTLPFTISLPGNVCRVPKQGESL